MNAKRWLPAVLAAALVMSACSREGFEESLNRGGLPEGESPSSSQPEDDILDSEQFVFDLNSQEFERDNGIYYYALPAAATEQAEGAARTIAEELEDIVSSLAAEIAAGREYESFELYDAITKNDGEIFSVVYEIEFSPAEGEDESYVVGLAFDALTGGRLEVGDVIDEGTLVTLILDQQASEISGRDEELVAKKREYLSDCGSDELKDRLTAKGGLDILLDASWYIDGSELIAVFYGGPDIGGAVEVSVDM